MRRGSSSLILTFKTYDNNSNLNMNYRLLTSVSIHSQKNNYYYPFILI